MNKVITVNLGGQERSLLYGTMGYFAYIKEATEKDSFEWLSEIDKRIQGSASEQVAVMSEDIAVLVYAGVNSQLDANDGENIPYERCKKWCNALTSEEASKIIGFAFNAFAVQGEATALAPGQENGQG